MYCFTAHTDNRHFIDDGHLTEKILLTLSPCWFGLPDTLIERTKCKLTFLSCSRFGLSLGYNRFPRVLHIFSLWFLRSERLAIVELTGRNNQSVRTGELCNRNRPLTALFQCALRLY